jgi:hypothetical protein
MKFDSLFIKGADAVTAECTLVDPKEKGSLTGL